MKDRVMVDIETLGLERDSAILSIGAVRFDRTGIADRFHEFIDQRTCQAAGLSVDIETLDWHLSQGTFGGRELVDGRELEVALEYFTEWYGDADEVWANSPSFDCEALEYAGELVGVEMPWHFSEERDVRTLKNLPVAEDIEHRGTEHDALDDAVYQARLVASALDQMHE
jgi:DNA polymerase III epsilon subunit-like protein